MSCCNEILNKKTLVLENLVMDYTILRHPPAMGFVKECASEDVGRVPIKSSPAHKFALQQHQPVNCAKSKLQPPSLRFIVKCSLHTVSTCLAEGKTVPKWRAFSD
jgi:hypothetical protein